MDWTDPGMPTRRDAPPKPDPLAGLFHEATSLHQAGRLDEAGRRYRAMLSADGRHFDTLHLFGVLRAQQGQFAEAIALLRAAIAVNPAAAPAHNNLGMALNLADRHEEAVAPLERAVALAPNDPIAHNNLGVALQALGQHRRASTAFERAVSLKPDYVEALSNLGGVLHILARRDEAMVAIERALTLNPRFAQAHFNLGILLRALARPDEARASFERVLALDPANIMAHGQIGGMHLEVGAIAEARRWYQRALAIQPRNAVILNSLVQCGKVTADDPNLAVLESLATAPAALPGRERLQLHFALGKAYDDLGQNDRSFGAYLEGNAQKRRLIEYDEAAEMDMFARIQEVFSADFLRVRAGYGAGSERPVFILGMMRSGSTLVEQILASHRDVVGGGERPDFNEAYKEVRRTIRLPALYPEAVRLLTSEQIARIGDHYVRRLQMAEAGTAAVRITDKMPGNFSAIGLIHMALPNARIIHTVRDPIDTCLSCFSKLFAEEQPFTYDLGELGRFYAAYRRLMAHWRRVLPEGAMLDVRYEDLVADFEPQARRIVAFCGLEWDDACLSFHTSSRPVRTASQVQVRQPLYNTSVGRWRPPAEIFQPLLDGLGIDPSSIAEPSQATG